MNLRIHLLLLLLLVLWGLQGCATTAIADATRYQTLHRPRPVRIENIAEEPRLVHAALVGTRKHGRSSVGIWKLEGADVWFRESTGNFPLIFSNLRDSILADLPDSSGWIPGKGETMDLVLVNKGDSMPGEALSDPSRYRLALVYDRARPSALPHTAVGWKGGRPIVIRVEWQLREDLNPYVVSKLLYLPAIAVDLLLSPVYLVIVVGLGLACAGAGSNCFK